MFDKADCFGGTKFSIYFLEFLACKDINKLFIYLSLAWQLFFFPTPDRTCWIQSFRNPTTVV